MLQETSALLEEVETLDIETGETFENSFVIMRDGTQYRLGYESYSEKYYMYNDEKHDRVNMRIDFEQKAEHTSETVDGIIDEIK